MAAHFLTRVAVGRRLDLMRKQIAVRLVAVATVLAVGASAWVPCAAADMFRAVSTGCEMPMEHDCGPAADTQPDDCCVVDARAPQSPGTYVLSATSQPPPGVASLLVMPVQSSDEAASVAYVRELLKLPKDPTYVRTSRLLL